VSCRYIPPPTAIPIGAEGAVLVVGAGSSGVQIAEELLLAGRRIYLSSARTSVASGLSYA